MQEDAGQGRSCVYRWAVLSDGNRCQCELRVEGRRRKKEEEVFESRSKYQTRLLALHKNPNLLFLSRCDTLFSLRRDKIRSSSRKFGQVKFLFTLPFTYYSLRSKIGVTNNSWQVGTVFKMK